MDEYLREPGSAAIIAAGITAMYIHAKARLNDEGSLTTSSYAKPAALVGILVYFIVSNGLGKRETISTDPF
jgi:hypothetical protein|tara:strand:- start:18233 stop:18445 length:213 start_codon:yes stop_codon:yes gene_type:complete